MREILIYSVSIDYRKDGRFGGKDVIRLFIGEIENDKVDDGDVDGILRLSHPARFRGVACRLRVAETGRPVSSDLPCPERNSIL